MSKHRFLKGEDLHKYIYLVGFLRAELSLSCEDEKEKNKILSYVDEIINYLVNKLRQTIETKRCWCCYMDYKSKKEEYVHYYTTEEYEVFEMIQNKNLNQVCSLFVLKILEVYTRITGK